MANAAAARVNGQENCRQFQCIQTRILCHRACDTIATFTPDMKILENCANKIGGRNERMENKKSFIIDKPHAGSPFNNTGTSCQEAIGLLSPAADWMKLHQSTFYQYFLNQGERLSNVWHCRIDY